MLYQHSPFPSPAGIVAKIGIYSTSIKVTKRRSSIFSLEIKKNVDFQGRRPVPPKWRKFHWEYLLRNHYSITVRHSVDVISINGVAPNSYHVNLCDMTSLWIVDQSGTDIEPKMSSKECTAFRYTHIDSIECTALRPMQGYSIAPMEHRIPDGKLFPRQNFR